VAALADIELVVEEQARYGEEMREKKYSAKAQSRSASINAVDTSTIPSPQSPSIAHLKTRL
jgi:hypothetical protein